MSHIYICGLADVSRHAATYQPSRLISLLAGDEFPDTPAGLDERHHLQLRFHDIDSEMEGFQPPERRHIDQIIAFGRAWDPTTPAIVHCFAGVSRSSAAALTLVAIHNPGQEAAAARLLRQCSPHAKPNRRMIAFADDALVLDGRLNQAVAAMGEPDFATLGELVEMPAILS